MKRYKHYLAVPAILVVGLAISQVLSHQKQPARKTPPKAQRAVKTMEVQNQDIAVPVRLTGPLSAYDKADIYAEVTGVLLETPKRLKTGHAYQKGELLAHVDDRVYKNNVLAQKAGLLNQVTQLIPDLTIDYPGSVDAWKAYLRDFDMDRPLAPLPEPTSETEKYYIASRNLYTQYHNVKAMEETLEKYFIRAPFDGVVTDADVNPGTLIRSGNKVATLTGAGRYEMEAFATPKQAERLAVGQNATLRSEDVSGRFAARITRINTVLDASQTVRVYLESSDRRLRDGLYLSAVVDVAPVAESTRLPKTLMEKGNRFYVVKDGVLDLAQVEVAAEDGDEVIVQGLEDGQVVLGEKLAGAYVGMALPTPESTQKQRQGGGQGQGRGAGQ